MQQENSDDYVECYVDLRLIFNPYILSTIFNVENGILKVKIHKNTPIDNICFCAFTAVQKNNENYYYSDQGAICMKYYDYENANVQGKWSLAKYLSIFVNSQTRPFVVDFTDENLYHIPIKLCNIMMCCISGMKISTFLILIKEIADHLDKSQPNKILKCGSLVIDEHTAKTLKDLFPKTNFVIHVHFEKEPDKSFEKVNRLESAKQLIANMSKSNIVQVKDVVDIMSLMVGILEDLQPK